MIFDRRALRGLYAVTPDALCREPARLSAAVAAALRGGARLIQYRDKVSAAAQREVLARELVRLCRGHDAIFIVNDDVELALATGADGVHLGLRDMPLAAARAALGPRAVIGVTCGSELTRALAAQAGGASYVSFGRFFESRTKPEAPPASIAVLHQARGQLHVPICAIGGVTPDNAPALLAAGAEMVAAAGGLFDAADVEQAARRYASLF